MIGPHQNTAARLRVAATLWERPGRSAAAARRSPRARAARIGRATWLWRLPLHFA